MCLSLSLKDPKCIRGLAVVW